MAALSIVEASIDDLQAALSCGALTSVDLVARYLRRISRYDCRGPALNSIPILNTNVFDEAGASDDRRASGAPVRKLEGIPFTVKDSFKVNGMTVASGSPAFEDLVASDDAFTVCAIRDEGGVLIGRTNMPPMAYGGMQRGIYGRAESPYNPNYLAAAFVSGSSNGSAVSTAASFAAFGMGEETVSSGRSPASNNALVAYTPSRGLISIRGNWPLYPTCDVVVPHTRSMKDMLALLEVITAEDETTAGDFWRDQPFISLPKELPVPFHDIGALRGLDGLRIAVPAMYIGGASPEGAAEVTTSDGVIEVWKQARLQLESLGAEVVIVPDFPVVTAYENSTLLPKNTQQLPSNWNWSERGPLVARGWDIFLQQNMDPNIPSLTYVDGLTIFPQSMRTPAELKHLPPSNSIHWGQLTEYARSSSIYSTKDLGTALEALEGMRKRLLDDYLTTFECDFFVFPAAGDVGAADADINDKSAAYAWRNGVFYSNGNRALRHLGVPSVTVPMGIIRDKQMPVGLTFAGRAYEDVKLLQYASAYEMKTQMRKIPTHTPALASDIIVLKERYISSGPERPVLTVEARIVNDAARSNTLRVEVNGTLHIEQRSWQQNIAVSPQVEITVDGEDVASELITLRPISNHTDTQLTFQFNTIISTPKRVERSVREQTIAPVARDMTMVVVLGRSAEVGFPSGFMALL
ncbi:Fc.00g054960.m01.CDS01 [Cosmosporella sp. VM-42]